MVREGGNIWATIILDSSHTIRPILKCRFQSILLGFLTFQVVNAPFAPAVFARLLLMKVRRNGRAYGACDHTDFPLGCDKELRSGEIVPRPGGM
jgi:hypothetical protein